MKPIQLKSSDNIIFEVDNNILRCSSLSKVLFNHIGKFDYKGMTNNTQVVLRLSQVNSVILAKILEWAKHHKHDPAFPRNDERFVSRYLSQWDADFFQKDAQNLADLAKAAKHLRIDSLSRAIAWITYMLGMIN